MCNVVVIVEVVEAFGFDFGFFGRYPSRCRRFVARLCISLHVYVCAAVSVSVSVCVVSMRSRRVNGFAAFALSQPSW